MRSFSKQCEAAITEYLARKMPFLNSKPDVTKNYKALDLAATILISLKIRGIVMKSLLITASVLLLTACASTSTPNLAAHNDNDQLCENHKTDFQYFQTAFDKEHGNVCGEGCVYTPSMTKNSDTMERIAGLYYLMNCDANHGRL